MKQLVIGALLTASAFAGASVISTWDHEATSWYGGVMFDVTNVSASTLRLTGQFNLNDDGTATDLYEVWYRAGSYVGNTGSSSGWTLLGTGDGVGQGRGNRTFIDVGNTLDISAGQTFGVAIFVDATLDGMTATSSIGYSSGAVNVSDGNLSLSAGAAKGFNLNGGSPFEGATFSPRSLQGEVFYQPVPEPASALILGLGAILLRRKSKKA